MASFLLPSLNKMGNRRRKEVKVNIKIWSSEYRFMADACGAVRRRRS